MLESRKSTSPEGADAASTSAGADAAAFPPSWLESSYETQSYLTAVTGAV